MYTFKESWRHVDQPPALVRRLRAVAEIHYGEVLLNNLILVSGLLGIRRISPQNRQSNITREIPQKCDEWDRPRQKPEYDSDSAEYSCKWGMPQLRTVSSEKRGYKFVIGNGDLDSERLKYNRPIRGRRAEWTQLDSTPTKRISERLKTSWIKKHRNCKRCKLKDKLV
jgi:hypothetical protein